MLSLGFPLAVDTVMTSVTGFLGGVGSCTVTGGGGWAGWAGVTTRCGTGVGSGVGLM